MWSVTPKAAVPAESIRSRAGNEDWLRLEADGMSRILERGNLSAKLTVEGRSVDIGRVQLNRAPAVQFVFESAGVFRRLMTNIRLYTLAKAYFDEKLNIEGSFQEAIEVLYAINLATDKPRSLRERMGDVIFRTLKAIIPFVAARFESDAHYSMSDRAYSLFLDDYMQYTCAKFITGDEDLTVAQVNKFQLIAQLSERYIPGLSNVKHLDIGCGWGGLISYFEHNFHTVSVGNTNSASQRDHAIKHCGGNIILGDFSVLEGSPEKYGLVTVIGMMEHLTPHRRSQLLHLAKEVLNQDGLLYVQCIGKPNVWIGGDSYRIAYEDVFPGHQVETRGDMEARFRNLGFEVLYAVDDAGDYAKTTALWVKNLEKNRSEIVGLVGEKNYRIFLGYLAYGSKLFASGRGSLMRYLLRKTR
jgi:cyclopropane-fatty-acyl-phospholipid synthase